MLDTEQAIKTVFLLVFFLIYGGIHLYLFLEAKIALSFGTRTSLCVAIFMLAMVLAPVIVHVSERKGLESLAVFFSWMGYIWMGVAFLMLCLFLLCDCYRILIHLGAHLFSFDPSTLIPSARHCFISVLVLAIALALYGSVEALRIRTEAITIRTAKIPKEIGTFRIVQISDLHLGLIVRERRLERILREVRIAAPDMLVSTGDLVDGETDNLSGLTNLLRDVEPAYGKFAVTGNHEFYAGLDQSLAFTKNAGFTVLRGEMEEVRGFFTVAGFDDPTGGVYHTESGIPESELLAGLPDERFVLLLKHQPVVSKGSSKRFDLQLSGHTHKGQIYPFSLLTRLAFSFNSGQYRLTDGAILYVSRGSGTWGPPMRLLAPPEITIIDLIHDGS